MENEQLTFREGSKANPDIYCPKYDAYLSDQKDRTMTQSHLRQLEENYESAFGEAPTSEQMKAAIEFVGLFFAEIGEMSPNTRYARACSELYWIIDECPLRTAENLSDISTQ